MSEGGSTAEEIPDQAFRDLLSKGKSRGSLSQDEVVDVLKSVELTHDLIDDVRHRLAGEGIALDGEEEETADVDDVAAVVAAAEVTAPPARRRAPRASTRSSRKARNGRACSTAVFNAAGSRRATSAGSSPAGSPATTMSTSYWRSHA